MGGRGGPLWRRVTYRLPQPSDPTHSRQQPPVGTVEEVDGDGTSRHLQMPFFSYLTQLMDQYRLPASSSHSTGSRGETGHPAAEALPFNFWGGPVGYLGYELKAECGGGAAHVSHTPDAAMLVADRLVVVDHLQGDIYALAVYLPVQGEGETGTCSEVPLTVGGAGNGKVATSAAGGAQHPTQGSLSSEPGPSCSGRQSSQDWVQHTLEAIAALSRSECQPSSVKEAGAAATTAQPDTPHQASISSKVFSLCHSKDMYIANIEGCKR
jgi:para-aminobenzoate synthetase